MNKVFSRLSFIPTLLLALPLIGCSCSYQYGPHRNDEPQSISFSFDELSLIVGQTTSLEIKILPEKEYGDIHVTYYSLDESIAVVDESGLLEAKMEGNTLIRANLDQYSLEASFSLFVYDQYPQDFSFVENEDDYQYSSEEEIDFPTFTTGSGTYQYTQELNYQLTESGDSYCVTGISSAYGEENNNCVYIPQEYNGLPVTEIASEAFGYKWYIWNVYIPPTIKKIGAGAFSNSGIQNLYYDAEEITDFAGSNWIFYPQDENEFAPSQLVQDIHLLVGPHVKCIPSRFFLPLGTHTEIHPNVSSIKFAKNSRVETIGEYAFYGLENVLNIHLPNSLKEIGEYAFYGSNITELAIPNNVTSIKECAFMFSSSLSHLKLSSNLSFIGDSAFYGCSSLSYLNLKDTLVTSLGDCTFKNCSSLSYLDLGNVENIGEYAFDNNTSLEILNINNNVHNIGYKAFNGCEMVETLYIGSNVSIIGNNAFKDLANLKTLYVASNKINELESGNNVFANLGKNNDDGIDVIYQSGTDKIAKRMFFPNSDASANIHIHRLFLPLGFKTIEEFALYGAIVDSIRFNGKEDDYNVSVGEHNGNIPTPVYMEDLDYVY